MSKFNLEEEYVLGQAKDILRKRLTNSQTFITNREAIYDLLRLEYGLLEIEQFGCMFLNSGYRLINDQKLFSGTVTDCATYPREIARTALLYNAVFVVLVHNHPSGKVTPSSADIVQTEHMKTLLASLDIALFDHIIVAGQNIFSMREMGLLT